MALYLKRGRPKLKIARTERLGLRLTKFELEKIIRVAKEKNLSKTDALLQGIDLLALHKPKKFKNISSNDNQNSDCVIFGETVPLKK